MTAKTSEMKVDGNAIGGLLREIFTMEMTDAESTCASCGNVSPVGGVMVYLSAPGAVVRCPACDQVQMVIVKARGRYWLNLTGVRCLQFSE